MGYDLRVIDLRARNMHQKWFLTTLSLPCAICIRLCHEVIDAFLPRGRGIVA